MILTIGGKMRFSLFIAALALSIPLFGQATQNTLIQPDCLIPFTFTAAGSFPATPINNGAGDNRTKGCAAWTLMYQNTGMTGVTVTLQSGSTPTTTVSWGTFAGTISTGYVNPIVSDTGGSLQAINGTADISWVRVNVAATGTGTLTGVLYGFRNSSAAVNGSGSGGSVTNIATGCFLTGGPITTTGTISASETVNAQTGTTYAILNSDCGKLVTGTNGSSEAYSIAQAGGGGSFASGWFIDLQNRGAGTLTLTPATSTVDGAATLVLTSGQGVRLVSDGSNYFTQRGIGGSGGGSVFTGSTATNPAFSATPTFSLADVTVKSPVRVEPGALTANVTSVTFTNKTAGAKFSIAWTQDGTGGRTVAYGASATNTCPIDPTASATTTQFLEVGADGSTVNGTGCITTSATGAVNPQTTTYQATATDFLLGKTIIVASGTFTITLVASTSQPPNGLAIHVYNYGSGVVTIARSGQNINGGTASYAMESSSATNPSFAEVKSDGTNYFIGGGFTNPMTTAGDIMYGGTTGLPTRLATGTANKVFVAGAPPSYIAFPERYFVPAANCNNATPGAGWSIGSGGTVTCRAGTNNLGGYIAITDTASTFATFQITVPEDWDTATNPYVRVYLASTDATNGHTVIPSIQVACYKGDGSTTDDVAANAAHSLSTTTLNGNANRFWSASNVQMNSTDVTGCVAGALMQITIGRATDTATSAEFYGADVTFPRLIVVQAN